MKLHELSETAKQTALENHSRGMDYEWWDAVYEDAKAVAALMGLDITAIHFRGFWSQGDGAAFTGTYRHAVGGSKALAEHAPQDAELHRIARALQTAQRRNFYRLWASISETRGNNIRVHVEDNSHPDRDVPEESDIVDAMNDFANWIYRSLEREYEYLTSDEALAELDYDYDEEGEII